MQIQFVGRNIDVTPALKTFTEEKFQRLQHRDNHITKINVTFQIENLTHTAEATLHLSGTDIHATANAEDMYKAIDELTDKLVHQIIKHKEKQSDHHR